MKKFYEKPVAAEVSFQSAEILAVDGGVTTGSTPIDFPWDTQSARSTESGYQF